MSEIPGHMPALTTAIVQELTDAEAIVQLVISPDTSTVRVLAKNGQKLDNPQEFTMQGASAETKIELLWNFAIPERGAAERKETDSILTGQLIRGSDW